MNPKAREGAPQAAGAQKMLLNKDYDSSSIRIHFQNLPKDQIQENKNKFIELVNQFLDLLKKKGLREADAACQGKRLRYCRVDDFVEAVLNNLHECSEITEKLPVPFSLKNEKSVLAFLHE